MPFEVKLKKEDGKVAYRAGVYKIENSGEDLHLFYDNEDATGMETVTEVLTESENIESFTKANIIMVKADRGLTIKQLEENDLKEQEKMLEFQWENSDMRAEFWDDVNSLEEAKAKARRMKFGEEEDTSN